MIEHNVLESMLANGGKFDKRLADLYFCADSENAAILEQAFKNNFDRYRTPTTQTEQVSENASA